MAVLKGCVLLILALDLELALPFHLDMKMMNIMATTYQMVIHQILSEL